MIDFRQILSFSITIFNLALVLSLVTLTTIFFLVVCHPFFLFNIKCVPDIGLLVGSEKKKKIYKKSWNKRHSTSLLWSLETRKT